MRTMLTVALATLVVGAALGTAGCKKQASKGYWIREMAKKLPRELCKDGTYFRECFQVSHQECLSVAREVTKECLEQVRSQLPKTLMQPHDGRRWGGKVGACAGTAFEKRLIKRRHVTARCAEIIRGLQQGM